jgi:hypothetical protein
MPQVLNPGSKVTELTRTILPRLVLAKALILLSSQFMLATGLADANRLAVTNPAKFPERRWWQISEQLIILTLSCESSSYEQRSPRR